MTGLNKRKERCGDGDGAERGYKRSKGGSGGKWQTPHQKSKATRPRAGGVIESGDTGIWVTCAKNQEGRATEEVRAMFEECAEKFYGVATGREDLEDGPLEDIEASIQKEVAAMDNEKSKPKLFTPVFLDVPCVLFFKTRSPVEPVEFVHRICEEIVSQPTTRKLKYVNRLTPMTLMAKATEKGLEDVAKSVLSSHFNLEGGETVSNGTESKGGDLSHQIPNCSYAIRPSIRNHKTLKRDIVIKKIAASISDSHKVDLTSPDKVILVEIYQTVCGMCVVGSDWDKLKRYNVAELYLSQSREPQAKIEAGNEAKPNHQRGIDDPVDQRS